MAIGFRVIARKNLYQTLVVPILEYGIPAWMPHTKKHCDAIERVQKRATRFILGQRRGEMDYDSRLKILNMQTLSFRRSKCILSFVAKTLYKKCVCESVIRAIVPNPRHSDHLLFKHLRTQGLHNHAIHQFPRLWSNIPVDSRDNLSLSLPLFIKSL